MIAVVTSARSCTSGWLPSSPPTTNVCLSVSAAIGNVALTDDAFGGAVGTLVMGPLADRFGRRAVLGASMLALPPLIYVFTLAGPFLGMVLLALVGAATVGTFGVTVVMGQEYLPGRIGLAAGITMGLSIGLGGVGAPMLGFVADNAGLAATMLVIAAMPVLGLVLALTLPRGISAGDTRGLIASVRVIQSPSRTRVGTISRMKAALNGLAQDEHISPHRGLHLPIPVGGARDLGRGPGRQRRSSPRTSRGGSRAAGSRARTRRQRGCRI